MGNSTKGMSGLASKLCQSLSLFFVISLKPRVDIIAHNDLCWSNIEINEICFEVEGRASSHF
jgi:hypothetical protein